MERLRAIADEHQLFLFEDGSQAHGATVNGTRVGRLGHAAAFSCMGLKPLAGTEGGYAIFEDSKAAEQAYLYGNTPGAFPQNWQIGSRMKASSTLCNWAGAPARSVPSSFAQAFQH